MATRVCPACDASAPVGKFCGHCGADLAAPVSTLNVLLRPSVFALAHRETVWTPRVSSSLFPRISGKARKPYRLGLILVLIAIVVLASAEMNGPLGVIAVIGWPLLFLIYVWQSDGFRDIPPRILATAMVLGGALGVGWWLVTGRLVASSYELSTGSSLLLINEVLNVGLLISLGGGVLMLLPALFTRLFGVPVRESLDGFVVGAFGALWYSTAAATTILAPQFAEGLIEHQGTGRMLEDAVTYGIAGPIATTAAGGLVGCSLWFRPSRGKGRDPRRARRALTICTVLVVVLYAAVWVIDAVTVQRTLDLSGKIGVAVLALITARAGMQIALLHEEPDPATGDPILCVHCTQVVPDEPFCIACGAAARASSRTSRQFRRESPPVPEDALG
ncbi:MAG: zinc ribbon domain-containing protein [Mycobacterium sp.]|nr:zinc ribbon domain-containing protein [Mycobacterium sp.]